jgi:hypothetical protein
MKKLVKLLLLTIAFAVAASVYHEVKGDKNTAAIYEMVVVALMAAPAIAVNQKSSYGYKAYFTDSADDRPLTRSDKELWDYIMSDKARIQTKQLLLDKKLKIETYSEHLMFTIPVSLAGRKQILNAATAYFEGRIPMEFNKGELPEGFLLAISHVRLGWATDATVTVPEGDVDYVTQPNSWPAALRNAKIMISQNSNLIQQFRAEFAGTQAASTQQAVEGDGIEFQKPFILEDSKPTVIEIYPPDAVVFPATPAGLFLDIALFGSCIRPMS